MATLGKTTQGASNDFIQSGSGNLQVFGPYTLPVDGDVSKISVYVRAEATIKFYGYIYADVAGSPVTYKGQTVLTTVTPAGGWEDATFSSPVSLTAGVYWVGVKVSTTSATSLLGVYDAVAGGRFFSNTGGGDADGYSGAFPAATSDTHQFSCYATYTQTVVATSTAPPVAVPSAHRRPRNAPTSAIAPGAHLIIKGRTI